MMEKLFNFEMMDLVPVRSSSVLSLLSLKKFSENQDLISQRQFDREVGGRDILGLVDK